MRLSCASLLLVFGACTICSAQQNSMSLEQRLQFAQSRGSGGGSVDWFLDRAANSPPLHPYRMRSQLTPHPMNCPVGTTWQIAIYRHWSDAQTKVPNLVTGTSTWGGCYPHMQIIHKGAWPATIWTSTTIGDSSEFHSDLAYTTLGNLDPCGQDDAPWPDRSFGSQCVQQGGTVAKRWNVNKAFPVRNPIGFDWGPYIPPKAVSIPSNWTPYDDSATCGYEMYCPDGRGGSRTKPDSCGPQWRGMPELPVKWGWNNVRHTGRRCPAGGCGMPLGVDAPGTENAQDPFATVSAQLPAGAAPFVLRSLNDSAPTAAGPAGVADSQGQDGCNTFGPTKTFAHGLSRGNNGYNTPIPVPTARPAKFPPKARTCSHTSVHLFDIEQFRAFPYNLSSAAFVLSQRQRFRRSDGWEVSWDGGFSMIMAADPDNIYGTPILDQYTKYGQVPTAIWNEAAHTGWYTYIMTVVKPVFNVPIGGTAYFSVTARGCNADRGGQILNNWKASIDGVVEARRAGFPVGMSQAPEDRISNIIVNLTSFNLAQGWHTLEIDTNQRSPEPATLGQRRRFVSRHMFEIITNWPNVGGRCTDWIQYPYFQIDYLARFRNNQPTGQGGVTWADMTRVTNYRDGSDIIQSQNMHMFDFSWLGTRGRVKTATLYMSYLGLTKKTSSVAGVNLSIYAASSEVLSPQWYNGVWWGNYMQGIPGFDWRSVEPQLTKISTVYMPLQNQPPTIRQGEYVAFPLDLSYINAYLASGNRALTFILRAESDTGGTDVGFSNLYAYQQSPGGLVPMLRMVPADPECGYITK